MARWNPWRTLRDRSHITLVWVDDLPPTIRGAWRTSGRRTEVFLNARLGRIERRAGLGHELVHDERGIHLSPDCPQAVREKEEAIVRRLTAERFVPVSELLELVEAWVSVGEPVDAHLVAREFDVPADVAQTALERAQLRRRLSS